MNSVSGCGTLSGRRINAFSTLNTIAFAPMASDGGCVTPQINARSHYAAVPMKRFCAAVIGVDGARRGAVQADANLKLLAAGLPYA